MGPVLAPIALTAITLQRVFGKGGSANLVLAAHFIAITKSYSACAMRHANGALATPTTSPSRADTGPPHTTACSISRSLSNSSLKNRSHYSVITATLSLSFKQTGGHTPYYSHHRD